MRSANKSILLKLICLIILTFLASPLFNVGSSVQAANYQRYAWLFRGRNTPSEKYIKLDSDSLLGRDTLRITIDLHGTCIDDSSTVTFDQPVGGEWHSIKLTDYVDNCTRGSQTVDIPLTDFPDLDTNAPVGDFHIKVTGFRNYAVDITGATLFRSGDPTVDPLPSPSVDQSIAPSAEPSLEPVASPSENQLPEVFFAPSPTSAASSQSSFWRNRKRRSSPSPSQSAEVQNPLPSPQPSIESSLAPSAVPSAQPSASSQSPSSSPAPSSSPSAPSQGKTWSIQSVSSMKVTKDMVCNQPDDDFINQWLDRAKELGANYVAVETPYENPYCGNAQEFTKTWIQAIRDHNMKVWHRHMPLAFEGIYNTNKKASNFLTTISDYIKNNPFFFESGDIFSPIPEPQNGGISGITYCANGVCQFSNAAAFNKWLRDAIDTSNQAFKMIGLDNEIKVGYYGLDGFVAWGDNNPDWDGILEDSTVQKMGNITIDHYPEAIGENMKNGLDELQAKYPGTPIVLGEWGTITDDSNQPQQINASMGAAKRSSVIGVNYWHLGMGGNESLINDDFSKKPGFAALQAFYQGKK